MYEDLSVLIGKGFDTWRKNCNICMPFLINIFFQFLVIAIGFASLGYLIGFDKFLSLANVEDPNTIDWASFFGSNKGSVIGLAAIVCLIMTFVSSYFTSGAVGMAKQALSVGRSEMDVMWKTANANWFKVSVATLVTYVVALVCFIIIGVVIALVCIYAVGPDFVQDTTNDFADFVAYSAYYSTLMNNPTFAAIVFVSIIIIIAFTIIFALATAMITYSIVIDGLGAIEGIRTSISFFRQNMFDVFIIDLISFAISVALGIPEQILAGSELATSLWSMISTAISILVLAPLLTVWWARLYMDHTGKELYVEDWI